MILAIVLGAAAGVAAAIGLRRQLHALAFLTWVGWLLVGTGIPVLLGQAGFLLLAGEGEGQGAGLAVSVLITGFCAGVSWAVAVTGLRLTQPRP